MTVLDEPDTPSERCAENGCPATCSGWLSTLSGPMRPCLCRCHDE